MRLRPDWDEYYMRIVEVISTRSTCLRRHVGSVLVLGNRILASGYNGSPSKIKHCKVCLRETKKIPSGQRQELCRGLHSEQNVLLQCCLHGISTNNAILYSTTYPCSICMKMLINAKIKKIIYKYDYNDSLSKKLVKESKIKLIKYEN